MRELVTKQNYGRRIIEGLVARKQQHSLAKKETQENAKRVISIGVINNNKDPPQNQSIL